MVRDTMVQIWTKGPLNLGGNYDTYESVHLGKDVIDYKKLEFFKDQTHETMRSYLLRREEYVHKDMSNDKRMT